MSENNVDPDHMSDTLKVYLSQYLGLLWYVFVLFCTKEIYCLTLRKHAYSNILKILPPKNEKIEIKILIFFKFLLKT